MNSRTGPERRRHLRHRVRTRIKLLREDVELAGEIFNISRSGCLLVTSMEMRVGERHTVQLPDLSGTTMVLQVMRTRRMGEWFAVATQFESSLTDEAPLLQLAREDPQAEEDPDHLF